jgi:hypothetical protein
LTPAVSANGMTGGVQAAAAAEASKAAALAKRKARLRRLRRLRAAQQVQQAQQAQQQAAAAQQQFNPFIELFGEPPNSQAAQARATSKPGVPAQPRR